MRGMRVVEAEDGEAGVRAAEENRPDLVLLDTNLPRMDGLAVTRFIRESKTLNRVPVVILSGHAFPKSREAAFAAGCSDYLVKPLDLDRLDSILHETMTRLRSRGYERARTCSPGESRSFAVTNADNGLWGEDGERK